MSIGRIRVISIIVVVTLVLIVAFQNSDEVGLSVLFWHFQVNKLAMILGLFLLGGVVGWIGSWMAARHKSTT